MCDKCGDTGYIIDHENNVSRNCECYEELMNNRLIKRLTKYQESAMEKEQNMDSFIETTPRHTEIKTLVRSYIDKSDELIKKGIGITFIGPVGTGKTHMMNSLLKELKIKTMKTVYKVSSSEFASTYINNIKTDNTGDYIKLMKEVSILCVDDIDKRLEKEWIISQYFDIINYRYDNMLPVMVTCNMTYGEMISKMDNVSKSIGEAIVSRVSERNFTLSFERLVNYRTTIKKPTL